MAIYQRWAIGAGGVALAGLSGLAVLILLQSAAAGLTGWISGLVDSQVVRLLAYAGGG